MLTGVINESMFENNELHKQEKRNKHEEMRMSLGEISADLFQRFPANAQGEVQIEDVKKFAGDIINILEATGIHFARGDILKLIDHMDIDASGSITIDEFVHSVEGIAEGSSHLGILQVHYEVG